MPTDEDLWAAHHLLNGKEKLAIWGPTFLPAGHPRRRDGKGVKYGCDFCLKVFTNIMDGRGHTQAHHSGGQLSSPLCPCNKILLFCSWGPYGPQAQHSPICHTKQPPFNFLVYLDCPPGPVLPHHLTQPLPK